VATETSFTSFENIDGKIHFSDFSASNDQCDFKITQWEKLTSDNLGDNISFVGDVKFELDGKVYQTEELQTTNFKGKKNCRIHAKSVFLIK